MLFFMQNYVTSHYLVLGFEVFLSCALGLRVRTHCLIFSDGARYFVLGFEVLGPQFEVFN